MQNRPDYVPPHHHPKALVSRYFEFLMHYTYRYPSLTSNIVKMAGCSKYCLDGGTAGE